MLPIIFWFLTFYFLYKFTFEFVVPLITGLKNARVKMEDVNREQQRFDDRQSANDKNKPSSNSSSVKGDYIDFEEIH